MTDRTTPNDSPDAAPSPRVITLDQLLKLRSVVGSGGEAKLLIQGGEVLVNGETETRRRRKLRCGDIVEVDDERLVVDESEAD